MAGGNKELSITLPARKPAREEGNLEMIARKETYTGSGA
jgi:hypothetical protein